MTSVHWYTAPDFARYCTAARQLGWTVSRMVGSFDGLSSKDSIRRVLEQAPIAPGTRVDELDDPTQGRLFEVLRRCAPAAEPKMLASIGRAHLARAEGMKYERVEGSWQVDGATVPFVVEAALIESNEHQGEIITAINNSPTYAPPFPDERFACESDEGWFSGYGINAYLASFHLDAQAPFQLVLHIACPRLDFKDRGKSAVESTPELRAAVAEAIWRVGHSFYHREEKHRRASARRKAVRVVKPEPETRFTQVGHLVIPDAYRAAAGRFAWALGRQIMYKARDLYQRLGVERELKDSYFLQTLLPDFIRKYPDLTAAWNVFHDARGHLWEPHGGRVIPLGTEAVEDYLREKRDREQRAEHPYRWDAEGPGDRYGTLLFIEKEGFRALLEDSGILNEFDVGLMSTKGMSTTDSRRLLQRVSSKVKILALHDFDVAGMSIVGTLSRDTKRFQFSGAPPEILDVGVRWDDIQRHRLPAERVNLQYDPTERLIRNGATDEEVEFLAGGRRVELNAFGNDEFVDWVRSKLQEHARKVVPEQRTLEAAWEQAQRERRRRELLVEVERQVREMDVAAAPANLRRRVTRLLREDPSQCWDEAVWTASDDHGSGKRRRG